MKTITKLVTLGLLALVLLSAYVSANYNDRYGDDMDKYEQKG